MCERRKPGKTPENLPEEVQKWAEKRAAPWSIEQVMYSPDSHHGFVLKPAEWFKERGLHVQYRVETGSDYVIYEIQHGVCPCDVCGHTYGYECEVEGCDCCSQMCD